MNQLARIFHGSVYIFHIVSVYGAGPDWTWPNSYYFLLKFYLCIYWFGGHTLQCSGISPLQESLLEVLGIIWYTRDWTWLSHLQGSLYYLSGPSDSYFSSLYQTNWALKKPVTIDHTSHEWDCKDTYFQLLSDLSHKLSMYAYCFLWSEGT